MAAKKLIDPERTLIIRPERVYVVVACCGDMRRALADKTIHESGGMLHIRTINGAATNGNVIGHCPFCGAKAQHRHPEIL